MDKPTVSPSATAGSGTSPTTASAARCDATEREAATKRCAAVAPLLTKFVTDTWIMDAREADATEEELFALVDHGRRCVDIVGRLCVMLASAGEAADADSLNPLEALHADALSAYHAATGIADPFAAAMAKVCADNRAATPMQTPSKEE